MFRAEQSGPLKIAVLSVGLVAASFLLQGRIGFTYSDEGFLWYGAVHALAGDVPIRDFQSYDPGRYYWSAFWMLLFGKSMLALRGSVAIYQALGLFCGMLVVSRVLRSWRMLVAFGFLSVLWMSPKYHRMFEISTALIAIYFASALIQNPSLRRHFAAGVFTGLAAFLGRNLGVYSFISYVFLILFVWLKWDRVDLFKRLSGLSLGAFVGYAPMLIMLLVVPGFYDAVWLSLMEHFDKGATNLPFSAQWPWLVDYGRMSFAQGIQAFSVGALFLILPLCYIAGFAVILRSSGEKLRDRGVFVAALAVGVMYIHYAFSRADLEHLVTAMPALLITLAAFPTDPSKIGISRGHKALLIAFAVLTLISAGLNSPLFLKASAGPRGMVEHDVGGSKLWVTPAGSRLMQTVERINTEIVPQAEGLLILPFWPALYVLLDRDSPLYEIYFTTGLARETEHESIDQLAKKRVNWVLIGNVSLREDSRASFRTSHPLLWEHLRSDFAPVEVPGLRQSFSLLKRRDAELPPLRSSRSTPKLAQPALLDDRLPRE